MTDRKNKQTRERESAHSHRQSNNTHTSTRTTDADGAWLRRLCMSTDAQLGSADNGNGMGATYVINCGNMTRSSQNAVCGLAMAARIVIPLMAFAFCLIATWNWYKNRPKCARPMLGLLSKLSLPQP